MKIEADGFCGRKATLITRIDCVDIFTLDFRAHLDTHTHTHTHQATPKLSLTPGLHDTCTRLRLIQHTVEGNTAIF